MEAMDTSCLPVQNNKKKHALCETGMHYKRQKMHIMK